MIKMHAETNEKKLQLEEKGTEKKNAELMS